jgi:hypothetical protein
VTDDVIERRTRRFLDTLAILERLAQTPWEHFAADPEKYGSAEPLRRDVRLGAPRAGARSAPPFTAAW